MKINSSVNCGNIGWQKPQELNWQQEKRERQWQQFLSYLFFWAQVLCYVLKFMGLLILEAI